MSSGWSQVAIGAVALLLIGGSAGTPAMAQATMSESLAARARAGEGQSRLLVEAKEIIYDNDRNTVTASGDAELYYQGRTLQADRVVYDRKSGRVFAEGNARLTEANGGVTTGERFELTDDFKSGFIDSLRVTQPTVVNGVAVTARFTAPRAERVDGETTTFERGTYTACEPCKDNPQRPPLWQVKAARIIHNNAERTIYYENASIELAGVPIAYVPYFWTPDPTVKRKTGFLAPRLVISDSLGYGASIPFFVNLAPNYDLTLTPTFLSRQGVLGQVEWRHRLLTGSYNIRLAGIFQQDKEAFLPSPRGAGDRDFRGSFETTGLFHLNERWKVGWDVAVLSDKWFLSNYKVKSESLAETYFKESISTVYLTGRGDRSYFDARGYYFRGLSSFDWQKQIPVVHPVIDYNKRQDGPAPIGGEVSVTMNVTSLTREVSSFAGIPTSATLWTDEGLYETCTIFEKGKCIIRGIAGTHTRMTTAVSWRRRMVDDAGQVWTPFAYLRADTFHSTPDINGMENANLTKLLPGDPDTSGRVMPAVGLEYRYPLVAQTASFGTHVFEPIAQIIARPSETKIGRLPNEDAQSLTFDDTNIFAWDKFSGYDRVEGGTRANVGAQYTITSGTSYINALFGQSYHLAGVNSYTPGDIANVGRDSGLETDRSDYVARFKFAPNNNISLTARGRFHEQDFSTQRFEFTTSVNFQPWLPVTTSVTYARYAPEPELGYTRRREGLLGNATYNITPNWFVSGSVVYDLDFYLQAREAYATALLTDPTATYKKEKLFHVSSVALGAGYMDECTVFTIQYLQTPRDQGDGTRTQDRTVMFKLELKTLGQIGGKQALGDTPASAPDGVALPSAGL